MVLQLEEVAFLEAARAIGRWAHVYESRYKRAGYKEEDLSVKEVLVGAKFLLEVVSTDP